jgi:hypothetical protein
MKPVQRDDTVYGVDYYTWGQVQALVKGAAIKQAIAQQAPVQAAIGPLEGLVGYTPPAAQPAPVHPDSARIDWLTNNPLDALDIFGHVKGSDAVRWIRQEINNAMLKKDGATHD